MNSACREQAFLWYRYRGLIRSEEPKSGACDTRELERLDKTVENYEIAE